MKNLIKYLFVLGITLLVAILTGGDFVIFLLGFELLLPVFLYFYVQYLIKKIEILMELPGSAEKGEEIPVEIKLINNGFLPVSCVLIELVCRDAFDGQEIIKTAGGAIDAKGSSGIKICLVAEYAGRLDFQMKQIRIFDCFHVLSRKAPCPNEWSRVLIKPHIYSITMDGNPDAMMMYEEGDFHSIHRIGDDVSEVSDIRPYRAGDTLRKIHWKLSAKTEELLVKEFSNPTKRILYVFMDFYSEKQKEWNHECFDGMAAMLASLSSNLLLRKEVHEVFWYQAKENRLHSMTIEKEEDIYEVIGEMTTVKPYDTPYDFQSIWKENDAQGQEKKAFFIDMDFNLYSGEQCIASMKEKKVQKPERRKE